MPWVYMLRCSDGSFYVGSARNLEHRVEQHAAGRGAGYTRSRLPVELVWARECEHVGEAYALEKQIQNWSRSKRIALIEGRFAGLPALSRGRTGWSKRGVNWDG